MIVEDSKGNMFNVELMLEVENNPQELRLLAETLYKRLVVVEEDNTLLKGILSAKADMKQGKVLTSKEYKERLNLKRIN